MKKWKKAQTLPQNNFDIIENLELIESSFQKEYNINLNREWLKSCTIRRFISLLRGLTKYSSLGQHFMNKELSKIDLNTGKTKTKRIDPKTEEGQDHWLNFAKSFSG